MDRVPNMISTKDLSYISDIFEWHFVASKKCGHYANEVIDEEIKKELGKLQKMHANYCQKIVTLLS
ncbi:MAG: spore coat protein [Bacilli bacterium]|nr:spore coat protein [Bacilli bacterium]MDD4282398.1 spore coat protein [Bacilli bacterium]MDD4718977.1 spore coat protein [Bacilli bacterium]